MSREAFEQWYMSLHGSDVEDLALWGDESPFHDEYDYKHRSTWMQYQAWEAAWEAQQARIDALYKQLEQAQNDRKHYGIHLATALKGDKLASEPVDQRLDAVRDMHKNLLFMLEQSVLAEHYQDESKMAELREKYKV